MDFVPGSHDRVLSPCVVVDERGHLFVFRWHKRFTPDVQKFLVGTCEPVTRPSSCNEYVMSDTSLAAAASEAMYGPREIAEHLLLYTSPRPVSFNSSSSSTLSTLVNGASNSTNARDTIDQNKNTEQLPLLSTDSGEAGEGGAGDVSKVDVGAADEKRPVMSAKDARLLEILSTASGGKFTISDSSSSIPHVIKNHQQKNDDDEVVDEDNEAAAEPYLVLPTGITSDGACAFPTKRDRTLRRLQSLPEELATSSGANYSDTEGNNAAVKMVSDEEILKNRMKYALPEVFGKARTFAEMLPRVPEVFRKLLIEMQSATRLRLVLQPRLGTAGRSNESSMNQSITPSASSASTPNAPAGLHHNAPRPGQPQSRPPAGGPLHRDGQHGTMRSGRTLQAVASGKGKSSSLASAKKKQKKKYVECELAHYIVSPSREFLERLLKSDKDLARCVCPPGAADGGTEADDLRFMEITSRAVFGESPTVFADIEKITVGSALDAAVQHNEAVKRRQEKHKHSSESAKTGENGPNRAGLPSAASSLNGNGNVVHNGDDDDEDDAVVGATNEENTVSKTVYKAEIRNGMLRQFRRIAYNDHGLPIDVQYDFAADTLTETVDDLELRGSTCLRPYQEQSLERFLRGGKARSGIVVLPCGAGKTLTGVAAAVALGKRVLVACINALSVYQWREQFIKWSIVPESEISVCTGKQKDTPKGVFITTYAMLTSKVNVQEGGKMSEDQVQKKLILDAVEKRPWGLLLLDEVHGAPADCFQRVLDRVKAHSVLGLTATLLREDGKIVDLRFLVGPKLYEANWLELTAAGHLAPVDCVEVRCPMPAPVFAAYLKAPNDSHRTDLEVLNPEKMWAAQALVAYHTSKNPPDKVLLFCDSTYAVRVYAEALGVPFMDGQTKHEEREILLSYFRNTDDNGCVDPTDIDEYERRNGAAYDDDSRSDALMSDEDDDGEGNNYTNDDDATNGVDVHQGTSRPKPRSRRPKSRPFKLQNGALFLTSGSGIGGGGSGGARQRFKKKQVNCIVISRVGDTALDLPMANVVVQVNGLGASRRQEAQRLGRVLRPKPPSSAGGGAFFYTLVSEGTDETAEAFGRQQWLLDQGFAYRVVRSKPDVVDFFVAGDKALRGKFTREDMRLIDAAAAGPMESSFNAHDGGALNGEDEHGPASQQTRSKRRRDGRTVALNAGSDDQSHLTVEDDSCRFGVFQDRDNSPWARALEALLKSKLLYNSTATTAGVTAVGARVGQSPLNLDRRLQSQGGRRGNRPQFTMTEEMADSLMEHYRREAGRLAVTSAFATPAFSFSSSFITALGNSALRGPPALQQLSRQQHLPMPPNQLDDDNNDDDDEIVEVQRHRTRLEISEADFTPDRLASICALRDLRAGRLLPTKSARLIQTAIAELSTTTNPRAPYGDLSRAGLVCAGGPAWQICLPRSAAMRRHGGFRRRGDYDLTKRIITGDVGKRGVDRGVTAVDNFTRPSMPTPTAAANRNSNSHTDGGGLTEFERATAAAHHTADSNNNNGNGGATLGDTSGGLGGGSGRVDDSGVPTTTAQDDEDESGGVVWEHLPHAVSREIENYFRHGHIDRPLAIKGYGKVTVDPADLPWSHGALSVPAPDDSESDEDGTAGGAASSPTFNNGIDGTVGGATFGGGANPNLGDIGADFAESDETGKGKARRKKATTASEAGGGAAAKPQLTKQAALTQSGRGQGRGNKRPGYVHPSAPQVEEEHEPTPFEVLQPSERMLAAVRGSATRRLRLRRHDPDHVCDLAAKDSPCVAHLLGMVETRVRGER